jgi:hypothetical protein
MRGKERIKFNSEILRLTTVGILTIGGGTVSLLEEEVFEGQKNFLIAWGVFLVLLLVIFLLRALNTINKKIR